MINVAVRNGVLVALLVLATACGDVTLPVAPTPPISTADSTSPPTRASGEPPAFPPMLRPARIYVAAAAPYTPMHGSPLASRYVLYDDGAFALQYASANYPFFEYRGTYEEANGVLTFVGGETWTGSFDRRCPCDSVYGDDAPLGLPG